MAVEIDTLTQRNDFHFNFLPGNKTLLPKKVYPTGLPLYLLTGASLGFWIHGFQNTWISETAIDKNCSFIQILLWAGTAELGWPGRPRPPHYFAVIGQWPVATPATPAVLVLPATPQFWTLRRPWWENSSLKRFSWVWPMKIEFEKLSFFSLSLLENFSPVN